MPLSLERQNLYYKNRELIGYGKNSPHPNWPNDAQIAISFVLNYEEGSEKCLLDGDDGSETLLCDLVGIPCNAGGRNMAVESLYEYGSRCGFWRIHRVFTERRLPLTVYACGLALRLNKDAADAMVEANWEVASHGFRWLDYSSFITPQKIEEEEGHIQMAIEAQKTMCSYRPLGFYQGKASPYTRSIVIKSHFLYDNDTYSDDLPYWSSFYRNENDVPLLLIPYTLSNNDMKFCTPQGFVTGDQFFAFLKDTFDVLYNEGKEHPKMMSVGLHCRIIGHPGRLSGLLKFLDYIMQFPRVWICRRLDIALHWYEHHYPKDGFLDQRRNHIYVGDRPKYIERLVEENKKGKSILELANLYASEIHDSASESSFH